MSEVFLINPLSNYSQLQLFYIHIFYQVYYDVLVLNFYTANSAVANLKKGSKNQKTPTRLRTKRF